MRAFDMQGQIINGFELKRQLGQGGMAEVWYAENEIGKPAAIKILNKELSNHRQIVERFHNEALVMVKLDHPNIRQVYGYGRIGGRHCIVMEYLEGNDLEALLENGRRFSEEELRRWWNQTVDALNYTHSMGIVHRDIKPANLFLDKRGNIKLLDFGIAKVKESISVTHTGAMIGTVMYMSPEQVLDGKHVDYRSDIYSLAVSFVHLLTGKEPYDSTTLNDYAICNSIVEQELDLAALPSSWRNFLKPYLAKKPDKRPALRPIETIMPPPTEPKNKKALWIALGVAAVLVTMLILLLKPRKEENVLVEQNAPLVNDTNYVEDDSSVIIYEEQIVLDSIQKTDTMQFVGEDVQDSLSVFKNAFWEMIHHREKQMDAFTSLYIGYKNKVEGEEYDYLRYTILKDYYAFMEWFEKLEKISDTDLQSINTIAELKSKLEQSYLDENSQRQRSNISSNGSFNDHDYVDLGLPSGTLWATCNVGASTPESYGNYYAWGETTTKSAYVWETNRYANSAYNKLTKYCNKSNYGNNGFTDNLTTLQASDDPAAASWGSGWCTPSKAQLEELKTNTTQQWRTRGGNQGMLFTSKKNGQAIFLPAAGYRYSGLFYAGSYGHYWSRSLYTDGPRSAWGLYFFSGGCDVNIYDRDGGFSVRPVHEK